MYLRKRLASSKDSIVHILLPSSLLNLLRSFTIYYTRKPNRCKYQFYGSGSGLKADSIGTGTQDTGSGTLK
jgi:hypothetical protein